MTQISKHISYDEAVNSNTATKLKIANKPNAKQLENMKEVAELCFEPMRAYVGRPLAVNSFFRSAALNTAVKGSKTSQHMEGKAIDIDSGNKEDNRKMFNFAKANLEFDQLINEYDYKWIHISFNKAKNRKQVLVVK